MWYYIGAVCIGVVAGVLSGLIGIGGGIIMIPALTFLLYFNQHMAQGTTLAAMLFPIGLLATWVYYKNGFVNIPVAMLLAAGFFFGGYFGAKIAVQIDTNLLQKIFGVTLLLISLKMIIGR